MSAVPPNRPLTGIATSNATPIASRHPIAVDDVLDDPDTFLRKARGAARALFGGAEVVPFPYEPAPAKGVAR